MSLPTHKISGKQVQISIPPGWYSTIVAISRKSYNQVARVNHSLLKKNYYVEGVGKANETMVDSFSGAKATTFVQQTAPLTVGLEFFYDANSALSGADLAEEQYRSNKLQVVTFSKPTGAPKSIPQYRNFFIFVEDKPDNQQVAGTNQFDDIVLTVHVTNGGPPAPPAPDPAPEAGIFDNAGKCVDGKHDSWMNVDPPIKEEELCPAPPYVPPEHLAKLPVGILGAGAAGMYTAMILDSLGIKYEILEASGRFGGRLYTHRFPKVTGQYQYFDAGAMRYPDVIFMKRTFDLVGRLKTKPKMMPVIMSNPNTFLHFNGYRAKKSEYKATDQLGPPKTSADTFHFGIKPTNPDGYIPQEFLDIGHKQLYDNALRPLRQLFVDLPYQEAFKELMKTDMYSVRGYMATVMNPPYPNSVIRWIESMEWRTGMFDASLTETVLADLSFADPRTAAMNKDVEWKCFDGGSEVLSNAMYEEIQTKPKFFHRVTAIKEVPADDYQSLVVSIDHRGSPRLSTEATTKKYSNIISSIPLSCLRNVDLDECHLSIGQRGGMRELLYSPSVKIGIQFKTAWWEKLGIVGGQSVTDRPARSIVYPSHGPGLGGSEKSNVLIASYNGMQDSSRLGSMMKGKETVEEKILLNMIMNDLAVVHNVPLDDIWDEFLDYHPWDWYSDPLALGAFAWFGPGQFKEIYPSITLPASKKQRLFFAGDATSACTGNWVAGALNSAWRCVREMLVAHPELNPNPKEDIFIKFAKIWGDSEEWDDHVLAKHVYLGRALNKRNLT
ncbi:L-amino acid oxidase [Infundibulicybe gibba]|nr:L-amino acid oxidase [Infundibulicybe gibba]